MKYVQRTLENRLFEAFAGPMITGILGPRRVGKSTLLAHYLEQHPKITTVQFNMDKLAEREQIRKGLLEQMILTSIQRHLQSNQRVWIIIDEAQKCVEVFEQIKLLYDRYKEQDAIKFILTGSALLELHRLSAESLAGRINLYYLSSFNLFESAQLTGLIQPPSIFDLIQGDEINKAQWQSYFYSLTPYVHRLKEALDELLIWGGLPESIILTSATEKLDYLGNYLQTYL